MKVRSLEIVDANGVAVITLDGDRNGPAAASGKVYHDEEMVRWPLLVGSLSSYIFTPRTGVWRVTGATSIISVSGGASAAAQVVVCSGVTALGSGIAQLSAVLDLEETGPNKQIGTLIATTTLIYPGDSVGVVFSGTLTGLVGLLNVYIGRVS